MLTLKAPIATNGVCFSRLLKCLRSLYGKLLTQIKPLLQEQSVLGPRFLLQNLVSNVRQLSAADDFSRRHFQMHFFLGALRVNHIANTVSNSKDTDSLSGLIWDQTVCECYQQSTVN